MRWLLLAAWLPLHALAADGVWEGHFIARKGDEGLFNPCRTGKRYATRDATAARELAELYKQLAPRAGRPVFLEFIGRQEAEDRLQIEQVLRMAAGGPDCREDPKTFSLRAHGANPAWRLEANASGLVFQRAGSPALNWPNEAFAARAGRRELAARSEAGTLNVVITPQRCYDEFARALFSLSAEVTHDGRTYSGCAYQGRLP